MKETNPAVKYQCRQQTATVTLSGEITAASAAEFHQALLRAANEPKAKEICLSLGAVERFDISAVQLLLAVRNHCEAAGRKFTLKEMPASVTNLMSELGLQG